MSPYQQYLAIMHDSSADSAAVLSTEKGDFSAGEIMSMSKYLFKKDGGSGSIWGKETIGFFNRIIRKLAIRHTIITENTDAIAAIAAERFPGKQAIYVSNYNDSGEGPSVFNTNWDGSHAISLGFPNYANVKYADQVKVDGFYFFNDCNYVDRLLVFDEKGVNYLLFGKLNHEQKVARDFIEFIGKSFESFGITDRYKLSKFCEELVNGEHGKVTIDKVSEDSADARIETPTGPFFFLATFSGFERKDFMRDMLCEQTMRPGQ